MYYVEKWSDKGFYNYGVSLDLGWFEFNKLTGEYKQIYEEMSNVDGWRDGEFAKYIVNETFKNSRITNFAMKKKLGIGEDSEFFDPYRSESK